LGEGLAKFDGTNWKVYTSINSGLSDNRINSITIDSSDNKWIGTWVGGITKYDGVNWTVYTTSNSGLPEKFVTSIVIDGSGNKWIGTFEGGLAVHKEGGIVSVKEDKKNITPTEFSLSQNYPNPFNPVTSIQYSVINSQHVSLKVYDMLGNEVAMLVNEEKPPGSYQVSFNTQQTTNNRQLSSGVYFYQLRTGSFVQTKKMIILK